VLQCDVVSLYHRQTSATPHRAVLQCVCCSVCVAVSVLQCEQCLAVRCSFSVSQSRVSDDDLRRVRVLQYVCCSVLQSVCCSVCCRVCARDVLVRERVLQRMCCREMCGAICVLQCVM